MGNDWEGFDQVLAEAKIEELTEERDELRKQLAEVQARLSTDTESLRAVQNLNASIYKAATECGWPGDCELAWWMRTLVAPKETP